MLIGVVSDTHNNISNIQEIVSIFNKKKVGHVIHTGDITNSNSLKALSKLDCPLTFVFGNNDRGEVNLKEAAKIYNYQCDEPPLSIFIENRKITIFHEPDPISLFLTKNKDIDFIFHGHTHRFRKEIQDKTIIFNPGECAGLIKGKNAIGIVDLVTCEIERIFF